MIVYQIAEKFNVLKLSSEGHKLTLLDDTGNRSDTIMVTIHLDTQDTKVLVINEVIIK